VTPGEQARVRAELLEQRDGVLDARCPLVVKRRWYLQGDLSDLSSGTASCRPVFLLAPTLPPAGHRVNHT
jgi:hypothetical protein